MRQSSIEVSLNEYLCMFSDVSCSMYILYMYMYLSKTLSTSSGNKLLPDEAINITRWIRFQ